MKLRSDNPGYVAFLDQQNNEKGETANGDDGRSAEVSPPERNTEQHPGDFEGMAAEGDEFDSLMKMNRHLAHQLNNLLTTILANAQLALLMVENEEIKSYLNVVEEATSDAGTMVHKFQEAIRALARSTES